MSQALVGLRQQWSEGATIYLPLAAKVAVLGSVPRGRYCSSLAHCPLSMLLATECTIDISEFIGSGNTPGSELLLA
jgi:hypothetical protein